MLKLRSNAAARARCRLSRKVQELLTELRNRGLDPIPVCDLVRITQLEWQPVIESYLAPHLEALLVAEHEEEPAFNFYPSAQRSTCDLRREDCLSAATGICTRPSPDRLPN